MLASMGLSLKLVDQPLCRFNRLMIVPQDTSRFAIMWLRTEFRELDEAIGVLRSAGDPCFHAATTIRQLLSSLAREGYVLAFPLGGAALSAPWLHDSEGNEIRHIPSRWLLYDLGSVEPAALPSRTTIESGSAPPSQATIEAEPTLTSRAAMALAILSRALIETVPASPSRATPASRDAEVRRRGRDFRPLERDFPSNQPRSVLLLHWGDPL